MHTALALTFLTPIPGIIAGAVGALGVLALYFLKLRRRPVRVSSSMLWDQAAADLQVNAPFQMIKPSVLLMLQLLAVALLAAALARPAIDRPIDAEHAILLIDRSASMNATDASEDGAAARSRLDSAKAQSVDLVERLPRSTRVTVIAFAERARSVITDDANRARVRQAILDIEPTDQPANLDDALRVVSAFVERAGESADEAGPLPLLALMSDGSFAGVLADEPAALAGVRTEFVRAGPPSEAGPGRNLGVVALSARRDFNDPATVRVFVRVGSNDPASRTIGLVAAIDGEPVDSASVRLSPMGRDDVAATAPGEPTASADGGEPGGAAGGRSTGLASEGSHTFRLDSPSGGVVTIAIADADDALAADDAASLVLPPPTRPSVLLVQPDSGAETAGGEALRDALEAVDTRELRTVRAEVARRDGLLEAPAVERFDLVVLDRVSLDRVPEAATLSFAAELPVPGFALRPPRAPGRTVAVAFWDREHPAMRAVTLGDVLIESPKRMRLPGEGGNGADVADDDDADDAGADVDGGATGDDEAGSTLRSDVLASGPQGPLIAAIEGERRRRIVVAFALDDTDWWRTLSFPLFVGNAVDFLALRPGAQSGVATTTGERAMFTLPPGVERATLTGPGSFALPVRPGPDGRVATSPLPRVGVYAVETGVAGAGEAAVLVAVNLLDATETALASPSEVRIGALPVSSATAAGLAPREIWRWFVVAAAALLAVEWLLYARRIAA